MAQPKPGPGQHNIAVERFEDALLWRIDQLKGEWLCNRSNAMQRLLWYGLQHLGETKAGVRAEYARQTGQR